MMRCFCLICGVTQHGARCGRAQSPSYRCTGPSASSGVQHSPMVGSGGTYLAFITGNLANMKVPAARVTERGGRQRGSEEGGAVHHRGGGVSIVTTLILLAGLVLVIPIANLINADPMLRQVFDLSSGYVIAVRRAGRSVHLQSWRLAVIPLVVALFVLVPRRSTRRGHPDTRDVGAGRADCS